LSAQQQSRIDTIFRKRVQDVQSVDRMIGSLQSALAKAGVANDTDIVFSSDNGYHLGEYRLPAGKMTAFDTDVHVPLVVAGPHVAPGRAVSDPVQNIDLCPTFEELGGAAVPADIDGHSLVPLLAGQTEADWRTASLTEHHGPDTDPTDPDSPGKAGANPPTYNALRTITYTYVEYQDGSKEYYDRTNDPDELHNIVAQLPPARLADLHNALTATTTCHGQTACWNAGHLAH
jgi:arylsulfatase A-like enzyme